MTYLEFFSELLSEMTGQSQEQAKSRMTEYEKHIEQNSFIHTEIPPEKISALRQAARKDPMGFLKFATEGQAEALKRTTTQ